MCKKINRQVMCKNVNSDVVNEKSKKCKNILFHKFAYKIVFMNVIHLYCL